jgi:hypothetical protein
MAEYDSRPDTYEHISRVRLLMFKAVFELLERAHVHDASKLVEPELGMFDRYTPKLKETEYGSAEYQGYLESMQLGLKHHYLMNRHHPEFFGEEGIHGMNLLDLVEMLCDWMAATERTKDGDIRRSIEMNRERFGYGDEIAGLLLNTLEVLGADGSP